MTGQSPRPRIAERRRDPLDIEVGLSLRRARLARGHSQAVLAEALGLTFQQVQHYERGANRVSAAMLVRAANFLEVSAAELLPAQAAGAAPSGLVERVSDVRGAAEMVNAYCALENPGLRRALLRLAQVMARLDAPETGDEGAHDSP